MPVLLLTTTGRRSGKARTTPLTFFRDEADLVVMHRTAARIIRPTGR
jgi:F420H(2)-dependent quinone reductase